MKLRIGDTVLENNVILAPMAGVTDLPFRLLCSCLLYTSQCIDMKESGGGCCLVLFIQAIL